jgi:hypothetical protein
MSVLVPFTVGKRQLWSFFETKSRTGGGSFPVSGKKFNRSNGPG